MLDNLAYDNDNDNDKDNDNDNNDRYDHKKGAHSQERCHAGQLGLLIYHYISLIIILIL